MKNIAQTALFAALSNPIRLRCLFLVATTKDVCVCEVQSALGIAQPAASKALNALRSAGLVASRRDANWAYYRLDEDMPDWMRTIVECTIGELSNAEPYESDRRRLAKLAMRPLCA